MGVWVTEAKEKAWHGIFDIYIQGFGILGRPLKYNSTCNSEGAGKDSWESLGQQGDQTSQF